MDLEKLFSGCVSDLKSGGIDESMTPEERWEDYQNYMNEPINEDEIAWAMVEFGPNAYKFVK